MSFPTDPRSLRIACYGFAEPDAGSVSSAGFVVLKGLLARGHRIDFFNKSNFVRPRELETLPNYRFFDLPNPRAERVGRVLRKLSLPGRFAEAQLVHRTFARGIAKAMRREHAARPYDVQLWLGDWAWLRLPGVPVVSWVQGPPETDGRSIARHRREIIELCGAKTYWPLRAYAAYRATFGRPPFHLSDTIIVGSRWSRQRLAEYDTAGAAIEVLPYPTDLDAFSPGPALPGDPSGPTVLWVGRTVPRKRLDLFLDACAKLIDGGSPIRVRIVGGFGFAPGYRKLIDRFRHPDRLTYTPGVPREQIASLLRSAAVLVQPSEEENFGSSVAEALACGTPVVLGLTNGTGDYCGDAAVRFPRYKADAVADAIAIALADSGNLCRAAREAAERELNARAVCDRLCGILLSTLGIDRPRSVAEASSDPVRAKVPARSERSDGHARAG